MGRKVISTFYSPTVLKAHPVYIQVLRLVVKEKREGMVSGG